MLFLFIPGVNNTASTWTPTQEALKGLSYDSIAVDCHALEDIDELARTVMPSGSEKFVVVGHSFGGMVALSILDQFPDRIQGIALVNSTDNCDSTEASITRLAKAKEALEIDDYLTFASGATARAYHPANLERSELMEARKIEVSAYGAKRFSAHQKAMAGRPSRRQTLMDFQGPKLVVAADNDVVIKTEQQKLMATAVEADYHEIATTGHMLPAEAPGDLAKVLAAWAAEKF